MKLLSKLSKLDLVKGLPITKFVKNKVVMHVNLVNKLNHLLRKIKLFLHQDL
jgi:hypothetical protein